MATHGWRRALGACLALSFLLSCGVERNIERKELEAVEVPDSYELITDGDEERFVYRLFEVRNNELRVNEIEPPNEHYDRRPIPTHDLYEGWKPIGLLKGPTADRNRECAIYIERATETTPSGAELSDEAIDIVESDDKALVRVRCACDLPQHTFD